MASLRPIHYKKFEKFLKKVGCHLVRTKKDLPVFEIKSHLRTLRISTQEYLNIIEQL